MLRYPLFVALLCLILSLAAYSQGPSRLELDKYLTEVKANNLELRSAIQAAEGAKLRSRESSLLYSPSLFADGQMGADSKEPVVNLFSYDRIEGQSASLGIQQLFPYGQQLKVYYNATHTNYINARLAGGQSLAETAFYETRPVIEINQSLWANGFGRGTRAQYRLLESQAMASHFAGQFRAKAALAAAEASFWRLSLARQRVSVQEIAYDQAKKIHEWASGRAKTNLGDRADALQAKAALEFRELELQAAKDEERAARVGFNRQRNKEGDEVAETLPSPEPKAFLEWKPAEKKQTRDDVRAAEEQQKAATALAQLSMEKDRPLFDVWASLAMNGRDSAFGTALGEPFRAGKATYAVGLKFVLPLNRGAAGDAVEGWQNEQRAAELAFQHKSREEAQDWKDLAQGFAEARHRLELANRIASAQQEKLTYERSRLRQGRTTTFQVLSFEQDFAQSQLALLAAQSDMVRLYTQMKLFGDSL